ncbi:hypothetical protein L7F22_023396 [Adiantum nelumboides]|nr:hypothetical protein [Adiantum nelumboides]
MADEVDDNSPDETEEQQQVNEEYKVWKKNTPFLYDLVISHALEWPSLTVQWLPNVETSPLPNFSLHFLLLGTHTSHNEPNYLMLARAYLPLEDADADALQDGTSDSASLGSQFCKVQIVQQINHAGEVNRARYMPQKPVVIATKTVSSEVYVFNYTKHPSKPSQEKQCSPELRLRGHTTEGYGLSWSALKEGYLLSGSDDAKICLWDINSSAGSNGILEATQVFQA